MRIGELEVTVVSDVSGNTSMRNLIALPGAKTV